MMQEFKIQRNYTKRESLSIELYLREIGQKELISIDEEAELASRIRQGDRKALDRMICSNLRFVVSVAKQYQNQGLSLDDLINEGNLGLMKAAEKFDETRGFKFISYAVWWIRQSILQALAEQSRIVRLPLNQIGTSSRVKKAQLQFEQENNRPASDEEIAEMTGITVEKVSDTMKQKNHHISVDAPFTDGEEGCLLDVMENDDSPRADSTMEKESLSKEIDHVLDILTPREKNIIRMCYGLGNREMTLDEISYEFGLTRERVRQIKEKAIRRLRSNSRCKSLRMFLG